MKSARTCVVVGLRGLAQEDRRVLGILARVVHVVLLRVIPRAALLAVRLDARIAGGALGVAGTVVRTALGAALAGASRDGRGDRVRRVLRVVVCAQARHNEDEQSEFLAGDSD